MEPLFTTGGEERLGAGVYDYAELYDVGARDLQAGKARP